ncbi:MAG: hypothetical protein KKD74_09610 [Bacteroidetes bacterium]|nr:hypothetical protein [Bacteroidales bacterium]MBU1010379.1 hypothetical protein [Bacteroidota bacterium]
MEILIIVLSLVAVGVFTVISFYTSVNSGAGKLEEWFRKQQKKPRKH